MFLSKSDFSKVIKNTPLISIDLCILKGRKILLGKRKNPPAKNFFFVPGGRIFKSELKQHAFSRILKNELGFSVRKDHDKFIKELGCYEHFYEDNFLDNEDFSTHYLVLAYLIPFSSIMKENEEVLNNQHSEFIWFDIDSDNSNSYKIHKYTLAYFKSPLFKNFE